MGLNTRLQLQQLIGVPLRQRQLAHRPFIHYRSELRGDSVHEWGRAGHFDGFYGRTNLQRDVQAHNLIQIENNALANVFLEARRLRVDFVGSHRHLEENVFSVGARFRFARCLRPFTNDGDLSGGNRSAAGVHHRAADAAAGALRARKWRREAECHRQNGYE